MLTAEMINAEAFWSKVHKRADGHWIWTAGRSGPYGTFSVKRRGIKAHRVAVVLAGRVLPDGAQVHHGCLFTLCVNPDCLKVAESQRAHSAYHLHGCARHGEQAMRRTTRGKWAGKRYCLTCARERMALKRAAA